MRLWPVVLLCCSAPAFAQENRPTWYFRTGPVFGQATLGSEDTRRGGYYAVGLARPEKRLTLRGLAGELQVEAYYMFTKGGGWENIPVNKMRSIGLMAIARYHTRWIRNADTFFDLGFGVVRNDITTRDLDSLVNTTPTLGIGAQFGKADLTLRWYHASNGGTDGNNQGLNGIQYLIGYRF